MKQFANLAVIESEQAAPVVAARPSFLILSLPRSRSAWLSRFLSYRNKRCGHDIAPRCGSVAEVVDRLGRYDGSCETGAMLAHQILRNQLPGTKFVTVRRPVREVIDSLARVGLRADEEIYRRAAMLDELERLGGVRTYTYEDLINPACCKEIFEHCLETEFDPLWWASHHELNIQVAMPGWLRMLEENKPNIERLKSEIEAKSNKGTVFAQESFRSIWPDVNRLFQTHFDEVDGDVEPNRPFEADTDLMRKLEDAGILKIWTVRIDGVLVGYCTWNVCLDVESRGLVIGLQGAWFIERSHQGLGKTLFEKSLDGLRQIGVKNVFPHHRLQGRGKHLGPYFESLGAKEIQHTYSLWIGDR
jgi:hypothetical protein